LTLANWITSSRFVLAPFIFWQLTTGASQGVVWALNLLLIAGLTDVADGWAARSRNEVSELGKILDPLADKVITGGVLLALTVKWGLPVWMVAIYLVKELVQVGAGAFLVKEMKQIVPANRYGKNATVAFFLGFGLFFLHKVIGQVVITIAILMSIYALYTYYLAYLKLKEGK
jgi:cardiolipin synthase